MMLKCYDGKSVRQLNFFCKENIFIEYLKIRKHTFPTEMVMIK